MTFVAQGGGSYDPMRNITFGYPRIEPIGEIGSAVTYEVFISRASKLLTILSFTGDITVLPDRSVRQVLGLTEDDIRFNLTQRSIIAPDLGDMPFLMHIAEGMKCLFEIDGVSYEAIDGIVVTSRDALNRCGIGFDAKHLSPDGEYALARFSNAGMRPRA